jgi:hypothetical protein
MVDHKDIILSRAFSVIPGDAYNRVSLEMREKCDGRHLLFYEAVLPENHGWEYLRDNVFPSLARFLKRKFMGPESGKGLVISLFFKDRCFFIEGPDFLKAFREMEGLNTAAFHVRVLRWLSD